MRRAYVVDLSDCRQLSQALATRPSWTFHGLAVVLVLLIAAAVAWLSMTNASLVVRSAGRVRPANDQIEYQSLSQNVSCQVAGRVTAAPFKEGAVVKRGEVLLQLDTTDLDNQIARLQTVIQAQQGEARHLEQLDTLLQGELDTSLGQAKAELAEAERDLLLSKERQEVDLRLAELKLTQAKDHWSRVQKLVAVKAITDERQVEAKIQVKNAAEEVHRAELPIDTGKVDVLRHAVELATRRRQVKQKEMQIKRQSQQAALTEKRLQLASLQDQRDRSVIRAPRGGLVTAVKVQVGDVVQSGDVGLVLAWQTGFEFEALVAAADVAHLKPGMPTRIKLDALDYQKYGTLDGQVRFVASDSEVGDAAATYKVKIAVAEDEIGRGVHRGRVKLGMTGQAEIVTDHESILWLLIRGIRRSISLG